MYTYGDYTIYVIQVDALDVGVNLTMAFFTLFSTVRLAISASMCACPASAMFVGYGVCVFLQFPYSLVSHYAANTKNNPISKERNRL